MLTLLFLCVLIKLLSASENKVCINSVQLLGLNATTAAAAACVEKCEEIIPHAQYFECKCSAIASRESATRLK